MYKKKTMVLTHHIAHIPLYAPCVFGFCVVLAIVVEDMCSHTHRRPNNHLPKLFQTCLSHAALYYSIIAII